MPDTPQQSPQKIQPSTADIGIQAFAQIFTSLVESFGWPGAIVVFGAWFIVRYATLEQKQRIIETFILGTNIAHTWPLLVMGGTFVVTLLAQHRWYTKKLNRLSEEVEREGKMKSELQGRMSKKKLQHANSKTRLKGK